MRDKLARMRDIVHLREVQYAAAKLKARARDAEQKAAQATFDQVQVAADQAELAWKAAVDSPRLDIALVLAWGDAVRQTRLSMLAERQVVEARKAEYRRAVDAQRTALLRVDVAKRILASVRRQAIRLADEHVLMAMEDRVMAKRKMG